jgi:alpha-methylacyl-CoA racemase
MSGRRKEGTPGRPPLDGIRIVDCSERSPGPYATQILADLGADVIIVERPQPEGGGDRAAEQLMSLRRGKRSIVLDLKQAAGIGALRQLAARSDVFVEGWRPGVADRLGAGFDELRRHNPRLIVCSVTGYGQTGPHRNLAGHDLNYLAMSGLLGLLGHGPAGPVPPLNVLADYAGGGLAAAFAITVALFSRDRGGDAGQLDVSMTDSIVSFLGPHLSLASGSGQYPAPGAHRLAGELPYYRSYLCADGQWISVAALEPKFFAGLCRELGVPELIGRERDPDEHAAITTALARAFLTDTRDKWFSRLREQTCVAPVLRLEEIATDPGGHESGRLITVTAGERTAVQPAGTPGFAQRRTAAPPVGPRLGEHTTAILADLGYGPASIAQLAATGAATPASDGGS